MTKQFSILLCLLFSLSIFFSCSKENDPPVVTPPPPVTPTPEPPPTVEKGDFRVAFYNVENLFDTVDDPENDKDDEFLPNSSKEWTLERYNKKLANIGEVIQGMDFPLLMGFAEVENYKVLEDLINMTPLKEHNYAIAHFDSPDHRGIDVALIYKSDFELQDKESIVVNLPASVSQYKTTRDILKVEGRLNGEKIVVFVNHWPSRSGGANATSGKREFAAKILRQEVDEVLAEDATAKIIAMGDFNDEPLDKSVLNVLKAQIEKPSNADNQLYNCTIPLTNAGEGSYLYQGNWQMIDQIIVSGSLLDANAAQHVLGFKVFKEDFLLFEHPDNGPTPDRTYGGDNYYGGYSDHLAVFLEFKKK
jgi:predicted extracellular nuclease